jgi:hypothetical protein
MSIERFREPADTGIASNLSRGLLMPLAPVVTVFGVAIRV